MDGKQLKNSILQWAIQGKLVPQNPKDGSAEDLYKSIIAEKQALINAGKLKKEKPLPAISPDDIPFDIPKEWKWCRIGDIFTLQAGKNITSSEIHNSPSKEYQYPCYGGNGKRGYVSSYNRKGHYCLIGRQGALCGNINYADGTFYATEHAVVVETYSNVDVSWSGIFLSALNLNHYATATAQPGLAVANINKVLIPLPPLAEQKRIVAKIEKVFPLIDEFWSAQEQLNTLNKELPEALKKSILQEAIQGKLVPQNPKDEPASKLLERIAASRNGDVSPWSEAIGSSKNSKKSLSTSLRGAKATKQSKNPTSRIYRENGVWYEQVGTATPKDISDEIPFEIPENWVWCRLEKIVSINGGFAFKSGNYVEQGKGVRVLRISDFNENGFVNTKKVYHPYDDSLADYRLSENDIVMCMTGGTVGKTMYVTVLPEPMLVNQRVADISIIGDIESKYVYQVMSSNVVQDIVLNSKNSTNDNISMELIKNFLIPLPPLAEQKRIVAKLEQLFKVL